ncbi:B12 binding domain-containing protein [Spirosomataceae bacterium TFI 002]|nr:B12 binding domain-containing protein [Spirosomataceae bacterium TFI 002]
MSVYTIKDLENLSGIKAHTLRIWEQRYEIITPKRTLNNFRTYNDDDLKLVLNIALLRDKGFKISKIAKFSLEELSKEVVNISSQNLAYPDQIYSLTLAMIDLDEERFEKVMSTSILQFGFENTITNIVYPFLARIGTLWMTGSIGPAQEHFISNLIRQKMIVAIDGQVVRPDEKSKTFVLFLPEGETHELGLLFGNYILRARNHKVIYLGQSLPFGELEFVVNLHKPDYIFSALTTFTDDVHGFLKKLGDNFTEQKILVTGYSVIGQGFDLPDHMEVIANVRQLMDLAE